MIHRRLYPKVLLQLLLLLSLCCTAMAAYPGRSATTLGVVIYPDRAMVKKSLRVALRPGENMVEITGLSPNLHDDSIQAGSTAADRVILTDIEIRRTSLIKNDPQRQRELQGEIDQIRKEITNRSHTLEVQRSSIAYLQKVVPFPQNQNTPFATVRDYLKAQEEAVTARLTKIAELEEALIPLQKRLHDLEEEQQNLGRNPEQSKSLRLTLQAESAAEIDLQYSYVVGDMQWSPKYEIRADSLQQRLQLNFFAVIRQSTGEDFSGIPIEISTARPATSGELPELAPWRLDLYRAPVYPAFRRAKGADAAAPMAMEMMPQSAMMASAPVEVSSEATSMTYRLDRGVLLPADNQPHKVLISTAGSEGKFEYLAIPRFSPNASLTATLKNPFLFPLPAGELYVYLDGRFVGTQQVQRPLLSGDEMRLTLGRDETILVSNRLEKLFTERNGAFSKKVRKHYEYLNEVVNGKSRPVTLLLRDRLPLSAHEAIKVETSAPTTDEAQIDAGGIITWNLTLQPGEKRQLPTIFDVIYPEEEEITGL